jgi:hypothetical protein
MSEPITRQMSIVAGANNEQESLASRVRFTEIELSDSVREAFRNASLVSFNQRSAS